MSKSEIEVTNLPAGLIHPKAQCLVHAGMKIFYNSREKKDITIFFVRRNLYAQQFVQHSCLTKRCMIMMAVHSLSQII